jgi:hypothetical protein
MKLSGHIKQALQTLRRDHRRTATIMEKQASVPLQFRADRA